MTPEAQEQFIKLLDERIAAAISRDVWDDAASSVISELEDIREKFLSLTQPQLINNDIPDNNVRQ